VKISIIGERETAVNAALNELKILTTKNFLIFVLFVSLWFIAIMRINIFFKLFCLLLASLLLSPSMAVSAQGKKDKQERRDRRHGVRRQADKPVDLEKIPAAFTLSWQFASENTMRFPALPESDSVYLPLDDGRVVALDAKKGELRWETQPGGVITSPLISTPEMLLVASRQGTPDSLQGSGILRAVNKSTGLTLWTREFPQSFCSPMVLEDQTIYAASEDQNFYALGSKDGELLWKAAIGSAAYGRPLITPTEIFVGTEAGVMHALSRENGKILWQYQSEGALRGTAATDAQSLFFGDNEGHVYSLERQYGKLRWRVRAGAAVESVPRVAGKLLIVTSFDNFVYGLEARSGDRVWKVRLQGRLSFDPLLYGENLIITPQAGNQLITLSTAGRVLGQFRIVSGEIIAPPAMQEDRLFIVTDEGLIAATKI
jgi:outer membrane protein assembly factor BamB